MAHEDFDISYSMSVVPFDHEAGCTCGNVCLCTLPPALLAATSESRREANNVAPTRGNCNCEPPHTIRLDEPCEYTVRRLHARKEGEDFAFAAPPPDDTADSAAYREAYARGRSTQRATAHTVAVALHQATTSHRKRAEAVKLMEAKLAAEKKRVIREVKRDRGRSTHLRLARLHEKYRADFDVVIAAVQTCGWSLLYAAPALRNNREIVLEAVTEDGNALE